VVRQPHHDATTLSICAIKIILGAAQVFRQRPAEGGTPLLGRVIRDWNLKSDVGYVEESRIRMATQNGEPSGHQTAPDGPSVIIHLSTGWVDQNLKEFWE
jgi:hypothetical protein